MKKLIIVLVLITTIFSCKNKTKKTDNNEHKNHSTKSVKEKIPKKKVLSPHQSTMAMIGKAHIHIDYSSPGVRGRIIFGGLVGYDNVWQAGAHNATWIGTNKDLIINNEMLPKGKYGFFTIPSKGDWTVIINKNWDQHGKDEYDAKDDVIRFKVTPTLSDKITEHLEYKVEKTGDTEGAITLVWEKVTINFPFKLNK
ncbi:DUF2911 domain-containing protein [Tenacibaculum aquimarinum]|uniref:DUF2911 domain-containing protein n=1 Tax=Tenacibaculum aquimarinum TaxID=2910675 RepID=UPI001F0A4871|nr:DUF2911 domain-containing protein [Tenacibaculum aquimarinum]MCH3883686.1 DUF2911 domain-containing protein [Tenacibaculum aquimarinum]